jgi:hypothetical protein
MLVGRRIAGSDSRARAWPRALRVMRLSLLAGELNGMHLSSSGALLSGAASIRLLQLVASVLTLLFTTSSIVHLVERIPFHNALYFVTTTLTTARRAPRRARAARTRGPSVLLTLRGLRRPARCDSPAEGACGARQ